MKFNSIFSLLAACLFLLGVSLQTTYAQTESGKAKAEGARDSAAKAELIQTQTEMAKVKAEVQAVSNTWANVMNAKNIDALMAMYADDVVVMPENSPALVGKAAVRKYQEQSFARTPANMTYRFQTLDVYSHGNTLTETGTTTLSDASGNVVITGKYVCVYEKRDGKLFVVREIFNADKAAPAGYKTIHLLDLPEGVIEAQLAGSLKKMNAAIERLGYPGAGYYLYKTEDEKEKNYRYFFEGVWPSEEAYEAIHNHEAWKKAANETKAVSEKIKPVEVYRRMTRVE